LPTVIAVRAATEPGSSELTDAIPPRPGLVSAPGDDVLSTVPGGGYDFFSGSSMAAAHVAGVVALLLERQPEMRPDELARRLTDSAGGGGAGDARASAIIDACEAVARLLEIPEGCPPASGDRRAR
jgi:subtilisin family serine protease